MRELERESTEPDPACPPQERPGLGRSPALGRSPQVLAVVGRGRLGTALTAALARSALHLEGGVWELAGPFGRGYDGAAADAVLLCVPDGEIARAAAAIPSGPLVGHCSGATSLVPLAPHEAFSLHPLVPVIPGRAVFAGAAAAISGSSGRARAFAASLARALGMRPVQIEDEDRPAYHAAASIASNFLVTLEAAAERLAATAGVSHELLVPLVRATLENWAVLGPQRALTGPVLRGDEGTVAMQRAAIVERTPELVPLFDAFVIATHALIAEEHPSTQVATPSGDRDPVVA